MMKEIKKEYHETRRDVTEGVDLLKADIKREIGKAVKKLRKTLKNKEKRIVLWWKIALLISAYEIGSIGTGIVQHQYAKKVRAKAVAERKLAEERTVVTARGPVDTTAYIQLR